METFRIELNSNDGVLSPGQLVHGKVVLKLREAIKARAIIVNVLGKAKTSWTVWETRQASQRLPSTTGVRHSHSESIPYSADETYLDISFNTWLPLGGGSQQIPAGSHDFPFNFTLPVHCPPSFEGTIGFIRYYCKAKIDRPWKLDDTTKCNFTVLPHFDLNLSYQAGFHATRDFSKNIGLLCFKHGRIAGSVSLPKSGYVPGEAVALSVEIINATTSKSVSRVESSLVEIVTYTARRPSRLLDITIQNVSGHKDVEKKQEERTVTQHNEQFKVEPGCQGTYSRLLTIPPVVPSFNICPIIQVDYKFKVKIIAKGLGNTVSTELPLLIGTIPVRGGPVGHQPTNSIPIQGYLAPPQPSAPPAEPSIIGPYDDLTMNGNEGTCSRDSAPFGPPPSYADSIFGRGTMVDNSDEKGEGFVPKYVYYKDGF